MNRFFKLSLTVAAAALTLGAQAADYPAAGKTITIVVPFAAGGPTDKVARDLAEALRKPLGGATVVIDNAAGAGSTIGTAKVFRANPDGYTLLVTHIGIATTPALYRKLPYKVDEFEFAGLINEVPMVVVGKPSLAANNWGELKTWLVENKGKANLANAGLGAASHLCGLMLMQALQTELTTVPYKGTAPAMTDLMGGQVDVMCDQTTNTTKQIQGGTIKAYAVTSPARLGNLPDIPTAEEAGLPGFQVGIWHGIYAPKGTPADVTERLSKSLQLALKDPNVVARFAELGTAPSSEADATPAALKAKLEGEIARWKPVIEAAGQYAD